MHRIQQVLDAAHAHGRKVAFVGRSMVRNMGIARDLGYLNVPEGLVVDMKVLEKLPANQVCLICTGSQGEPMAALSRMANRDHVIRITEGDTVLLASSLIPGNENAIYRIINELTRWGANVVHKGNAKVHVSGHASAGELVYCYNIVKPRNVMPVHGEWRHLARQRRPGDPDRRRRRASSSPRTASWSTWSTAGCRSPARCRPATSTSTARPSVARPRPPSRTGATLAEEGVITVVAIVDADTGRLAEPPDFLARGFVHDDATFDDVVPLIEKALARAAEEGVGGATQLEQLISRAVEQLGAPRLPAQPDDHPDGHRRPSISAYYQRRPYRPPAAPWSPSASADRLYKHHAGRGHPAQHRRDVRAHGAALGR